MFWRKKLIDYIPALSLTRILYKFAGSLGCLTSALAKARWFVTQSPWDHNMPTATSLQGNAATDKVYSKSGLRDMK